MSRGRRAGRAAIAVALGVTVCLGAAAPAQADDSTNIVFSPVTSASFEYGMGWHFEALVAQSPGVFETFAAVDADTGEPFPAQNYPSWDTFQKVVRFFPTSDLPPLSAGVHNIIVNYSGSLVMGGTFSQTTAEPFELTITPAAVGIDLTVGADPNNSGNAIVAARMTGTYIDSVYPEAGIAAPAVPAGTWTITITDRDGGAPTVHTVEQEAGTNATTSFYWSEVPPDSVYSVTATYAPVADAAGNFAFAAAAPVSFTGPKAAAQPVPTSTATPAPDISDAIVTGASLPLWGVIGMSAILAALLVVAVVQIVRAGRRSPAVAVATPAVDGTGTDGAGTEE